ncbi:MAG: SprT-like domain-containing protein [Desulfobulbaceae bacterium]|nr:SprT-like domain-containing protein [Desulfobulbaceae bacterium]
MKNNSGKLQTLWLRQLAKEFEEICWSRGIRLRKPIFEISEAKTRHGSWHPTTGTLRISSRVIENHSWDVTVNILKHEMAHQYCSEHYGEIEAPHGPEFLRACEILGVPESFRGASGDLAEELKSGKSVELSTEAGRRIIAKVKKLLALAGSENEHEAALAMQKAGELMDAHNLQQLELDRREGYVYHIIELRKKQVARHIKSICTILRDFFHVEVVISSQYFPPVDQEYKTIELLGREENVAIAEHCFHFLEHKLQALWDQNHNHYKGNTRAAKASYHLGLLQGFRGKLKSRQQGYRHRSATEIPSVQNISALMAMEDQHLHAFVQQRFPSLCSRKSPAMTIIRDTYEQGLEDGRKIVLHGAVTKQDPSFGGFLK